MQVIRHSNWVLQNDNEFLGRQLYYIRYTLLR